MLRAKYLQYEMSGQSTVQSVPTPLSAEMLPGMQPPSTPVKRKSSTPDRNHWLAKMQQVGKRTIWHSPTPRKVKKKPLLFTPTKPSQRKILPKVEEEIPSERKTEVKRKRVSVNLFSPSKVKVWSSLFRLNVQFMMTTL